MSGYHSHMEGLLEKNVIAMSLGIWPKQILDICLKIKVT